MKPRKSVAEKARDRDGELVNLTPPMPRRSLAEWAEILPEDSFVGRAVKAALEPPTSPPR